MRFGMPLLDRLRTPRRLHRLRRRRHLVVIGMLIKYVEFWKAKLCYVLSMWSLLLPTFRVVLSLRRYQIRIQLLHYPNGRVSRRGLR